MTYEVLAVLIWLGLLVIVGALGWWGKRVW